MTNSAQRPGSEWLRPEATLQPRARSTQGRLRLFAAAGSLAAVLGVAWFVVDGDTADTTPLSFRLEEVAPAASGIDFQHDLGSFSPFFENVYPFMKAVSAAACTSDVDKDGLLDVYFVDSGDGEKSKLFWNQGGFKFEAANLPIIEGLSSQDGFASDCVFADVDNDGYDDLWVGMVGHAPWLFKNVDDGAGRRGFVDVSRQAGIPDYMNGFSASFFDLENDGDLDLVFASYFGETYQEKDIPGRPRIHPHKVPDHEAAGRMMPNNFGNADNGGRKHLLLNDGTGTFTAVDVATYGFTDERFTFDIGTADINQDGFTDLYFANDFGPDQLYLNRGGKQPAGAPQFVEVKGLMPNEVGQDPFKGMNADLADMDHDGFPEIYVTNVFHPVLPEGNLLWKNKPAKDGDAFLRDFQNVAGDLGARDGGWGWGAKFVDIDLDGDTDIVATNGYISQNPKSEYWYRMARLVAGDRNLIVDTRKWPAFGDRSMSGHEMSHVFIWDGNRFHDRAKDAGIHRSWDGRGVLLADFDVDGRVDVLFVPQGQPYFLGRNVAQAVEGAAAPRFIGVVLEGDGVRVSKNAVGARVEFRPSDGAAPHAPKPLYREVSAGNGMSAQSMRWLVAGLGDYAGAVDVTVRWPDGAVHEHKALPSGRYHTFTRAPHAASLEPTR